MRPICSIVLQRMQIKLSCKLSKVDFVTIIVWSRSYLELPIERERELAIERVVEQKFLSKVSIVNLFFE